jgi:hypothetical protein
MVNFFRPVDGDVVGTERVAQGHSWKNISFSKNATPEDYQNRGLYLEIADKPTIDDSQYLEQTGEIINHVSKTVTLQFTIRDKDPLRVWENEMARLDTEAIPRWFEDHLIADHKGITDSPFLQEKLDRKLLKRAQKPNT